MDKLLVGYEGCSFNWVVSTIGKEPHVAILQKKWRDLARELDVPTTMIHKLRLDILHEKRSEVDMVEEVLIEWASCAGKQATFKMLLEVLEHRLQWKAMAEHLHDKMLENLTWENLSSASQTKILERQVKFLETNTSLKELLNKFGEGQEVENIKNELKGNILLELLHSDNVSLAHDTVPVEVACYISRRLSKRVKIDPKLFAEECPDIFVFKGIDRVTLSELASPNRTSVSTKQLLEITSRFIFLIFEQDWEVICENATVPIHLIKCEVPDKIREYILEATKGDSKVLDKHAKRKSAANSESVMEEDFIKQLKEIKGPSGLCICDSPGMGKSWLLANLARSIRNKYPNNIVFFTPLSTFARNSEKRLIPNANMTQEIACSIMLDSISTNPLSKVILLMLFFKGNVLLEMFFDGLDEVSIEDLQWTTNILKALINGTGNVRIYITSRPHVRRHLEKTLGVVAYDILPFTRQNQINFIVDSWHLKIAGAPKEKLTKFATHCLEHIQGTFDDKERDMMGIPLQCFFLAEAYTPEAKLNADAERELDTPLMKITSVYNMYKTVIDKQFSSENLRVKVFVGPEETTEEIIKSARSYHLRKALQLLFPEFKTDYAGLEDVNKRASKSMYLSFGLLEDTLSLCTDSSTDSQWNVNFVHRTFAEYLAADYCAHILVKNYTNVETDNDAALCRINFYVQKLFSHLYDDNGIDSNIFRHQVILNFLNGYLRNNEPIYVEQFVANTVLNSLDAAGFIGALRLAIRHNYGHLFELLQNILRSTNVHYLASYQKYLTEPNIHYDNHDVLAYCNWPDDPLRFLFCLSAEYASAEMTDQCFQLFRESFQIDVEKMCQQWNTFMKRPLEIAVKRGDYELVEYLIEKFSYEPENLLRSCIESIRCNESRGKVRNCMEICRLLLKKSSCLKSAIKCLMQNVIGKRFLHKEMSLDFIIFLLDNGADPEVTDKKRFTILHRAADYLPSSDYNELCHYLSKKFKQLFRPNKEKWISPVHYILRKRENVSKELIEMILDTSGIDVSKAVDDNDNKYGWGDNLITAAVRGRHSVGVMKALIRRGVDINFKHKYGENVLHLAATEGNVETVEFFASLGVPLEEKNMVGDTPFLCAYKHLETMKYLVSKGANMYATDNHGNNVAHLAADKGWKNEEESLKVMAFLIESIKAPALFQAKINKGQTVLQVAEQRNWTKLSEYLTN